jgi:DNA polymerase-4
VRLADGVASRLRAHGSGARTISVKIRFADFSTITRSHTVTGGITTAHAILAAATPLLLGVQLKMGVRLLGISASNLTQPAEQLTFDDVLGTGLAPTDLRGTGDGVASSEQDWLAASDAIDRVRDKFGSSAIGPASSVSGNGLRLVRRGAQQWGPDHDHDHHRQPHDDRTGGLT